MLLERGGVAGAWDENQRGEWTDCERHALAETGELDVVLPGHEERWHRDLAEALPQRQLGAGPVMAQRSRQSGRCVREPRGSISGLTAEIAEQRARQPLVDERGDPFVALALDSLRQRFVSRETVGPLAEIIDPGSRADEDQPLDDVRLRKGEVQAHPAAERVAHVSRPAAGLAELRGRSVEVAESGRRLAVTGQIRREDLVACCEDVRNLAPGLACLSKAVHQHDTRALAPAFECQWRQGAVNVDEVH